MANQNNNLLDFQDPGKLSEELLDMPGFVNELTNYTLGQSHSPNRALAFLGATALQAHLAGRSYADTHGTLIVRMNEKIAKLAMIHAISGSPEKPIITGEGVRWAAKFVTHITKAMLHEAQFHVAEGKFDALVKRAMAFLEKSGGAADRSALLRHLHTDALTLKKIVNTLLMSELIEGEVVSNGKGPQELMKVTLRDDASRAHPVARTRSPALRCVSTGGRSRAHEPLRSCPHQRPLVGTTVSARAQREHRLQGPRP